MLFNKLRTVSAVRIIYKILNLPLVLQFYQLKAIHATVAELVVQIKRVGRPYHGQIITPVHRYREQLFIKISIGRADKFGKARDIIMFNVAVYLCSL